MTIINSCYWFEVNLSSILTIGFREGTFSCPTSFWTVHLHEFHTMITRMSSVPWLFTQVLVHVTWPKQVPHYCSKFFKFTTIEPFMVAAWIEYGFCSVIHISLNRWTDSVCNFHLNKTSRGDNRNYALIYHKRALATWIYGWGKSRSGATSRVGLQSIGCLTVTRVRRGIKRLASMECDLESEDPCLPPTLRTLGNR